MGLVLLLKRQYLETELFLGIILGINTCGSRLSCRLRNERQGWSSANHCTGHTIGRSFDFIPTLSCRVPWHGFSINHSFFGFTCLRRTVLVTNLVLEFMKRGRFLTLLFPVRLDAILVLWKWTVSKVVMRISIFYNIAIKTFNLTVVIVGVRGNWLGYSISQSSLTGCCSNGFIPGSILNKFAKCNNSIFEDSINWLLSVS